MVAASAPNHEFPHCAPARHSDLESKSRALKRVVGDNSSRERHAMRVQPAKMGSAIWFERTRLRMRTGLRVRFAMMTVSVWPIAVVRFVGRFSATRFL